MGANCEGGCIGSMIKYNIIEETYKWDSNLLYGDSLQKGVNLNKKIYLLGGQRPYTCQIYDSK